MTTSILTLAFVPMIFLLLPAISICRTVRILQQFLNFTITFLSTQSLNTNRAESSISSKKNTVSYLRGSCVKNIFLDVSFPNFRLVRGSAPMRKRGSFADHSEPRFCISIRFLGEINLILVAMKRHQSHQECLYQK